MLILITVFKEALISHPPVLVYGTCTWGTSTVDLVLGVLFIALVCLENIKKIY